MLAILWACTTKARPMAEDLVGAIGCEPAPSELAQLMRRMHIDAKLWRTQVLTGEPIAPASGVYNELVRRKPTKPEVKGEKFESRAMDYGKKLNAFFSAAANKNISAFNNVIGACITCHSDFCPGPVSTIQKLRIPRSN